MLKMKKQPTMEMKNAFDGLNSRLDMTEGKSLWASGYGDRIPGNQKAKKRKTEKKYIRNDKEKQEFPLESPCRRKRDRNY